jgi:hypothetical protein
MDGQRVRKVLVLRKTSIPEPAQAQR